MAWTGIAWIHSLASRKASAGDVVAVTFGGRRYSERYFGFRCSKLISSHTQGLRTRSDTGYPLFARTVAIAVPNDPPPSTATFVCAAWAGDRRIRDRDSQSSSSNTSSLTEDRFGAAPEGEEDEPAVRLVVRA